MESTSAGRSAQPPEPHACDPDGGGYRLPLVVGRLRSRRYVRLHRSIHVDRAADLDLALRCDAALAIAPPGAALSGRTATQLYELPLPNRYPGSTDVRPQLMADAALPRTVDVEGLECRLCRLPAEHVRVWRGRQVTSPARTFLDLAVVLDVIDLVAVGDAILARGLATRQELAAVVGWAQRRRGVRAARAALELLDPRVRSPQESRLRARILLAGLPVPEVNAIVLDAHGEFLAEGDLVWRRWRILVEYDGAVHLSERQRRRDAVRRNQLLMEGWLQLVYTSDVLARHPERIYDDILAALRSRGWPLAPVTSLGNPQ